MTDELYPTWTAVRHLDHDISYQLTVLLVELKEITWLMENGPFNQKIIHRSLILNDNNTITLDILYNTCFKKKVPDK